MTKSDLVTDYHPFGNRETLFYLNNKENREKVYKRKIIDFYAVPMNYSL